LPGAVLGSSVMAQGSVRITRGGVWRRIIAEAASAQKSGGA